MANHISWRVENGVIQVYFEEDRYWVNISNYRLNMDHFTGRIYLDDYDWDFDLVHTSTPHWNDYTYGYGGYYYAPGTDGATPGSAAVQRPQRTLARK